MALNITKGEATVKYYERGKVWFIEINGKTVAEALTETNAHLIADAFNTANKTGLLPSELAEQNEKLKEIIEAFGKSCFYKGFEKAIKDDANRFTAWREEAGELLAKFKQFQFPSIEQPAPLTLSEADEAMSNGYHVAHNDYQASAYLFKKNGAVCGDDGIPYLGKPTILHVVAPSDNFKTGWRIVQPKDQQL